MSCFSENLACLKSLAGVSSSAMARKLGLPTTTITRLLEARHAPRLSSVNLISSRLGIDAYTLEKESHETNASVFKEAAEVLKRLPDAGVAKNVISPKKAGITVMRANEKDFEIEPQDLFNHALIAHKFACAQALLKKDPDFIGFLALKMPTDELAPTVPRGSIAYLSVESDVRNPAPSSDFAVGLVEERRIFTFGVLEIAQGKMFISPINPRFQGSPIEVFSVVARVRGWLVITKN